MAVDEFIEQAAEDPAVAFVAELFIVAVEELRGAIWVLVV